jgi:hypothetical protein
MTPPLRWLLTILRPATEDLLLLVEPRALGSRSWWCLHEGSEIFFDGSLAGFGELDEAEGLEPSLRGPHGKKHLDLLADCGVANLEDQFDFEFLIERLVEVHEAAGDGELMQLAAQLALVGQANDGEHRSTELHTEWAIFRSFGFGRGWN